MLLKGEDMELSELLALTPEQLLVRWAAYQLSDRGTSRHIAHLGTDLSVRAPADEPTLSWPWSESDRSLALLCHRTVWDTHICCMQSRLRKPPKQAFRPQKPR